MAVTSADTSEDDSFNQKSQSFLTWTQQQNIILSPKIKLIDSRHLNLGRAVYATDNIGEDEDLFTIPRTAILTPQTTTLATQITSELVDPWLSLILVLMYENELESSPWKPYLDLLPDDFDTLMYWDESELNLLQGSAVLGKIGKERANETFSTRVIPVIRKHSDTFNAGMLTDEDLLSLCHRMGSIIMAYAFDLERASKDNNLDDASAEDGWEVDSDEGAPLPVGMVPMADMLNADGDRNNAKLFYEEDKVVMRSITKIAAGEEILNDYGPNPSGDLLRRYGYVSPMYARYDVVEIGQALVVSVATDTLKISEAEIQARLEYLEAELPVDAFDLARGDAEDGQFPVELIAVLRCLAMDKAAFEKLKSKGKLPSDKALSKEEDAVLRVLRAVVLRRRQDYTRKPTQQGPSEAQASHNRQIRRHTMAQQVISGEKTVLEEAMSTINELLSTTNNKRQIEHLDPEASLQHKKQRT